MKQFQGVLSKKISGPDFAVFRWITTFRANSKQKYIEGWINEPFESEEEIILKIRSVWKECA